MDTKRVITAVLMGAFLGIFCIVGVGWRIGYSGNEVYLIGMWYNRVVMGLLIGLAADVTIIDSEYNYIVRGFVLGLVVTTAILVSTEFRDVPSFFAGLAYGVIIDWAATRQESSSDPLMG